MTQTDKTPRSISSEGFQFHSIIHAGAVTSPLSSDSQSPITSNHERSSMSKRYHN
jgi:hypothetical protein